LRIGDVQLKIPKSFTRTKPQNKKGWI